MLRQDVPQGSPLLEVAMGKSSNDARVVLSPGLKDAPVLDRMCSQFVLTLTMRHVGRFNLRRDWNSLLSLTGRHLVWPASVLARLREFLNGRCKGDLRGLLVWFKFSSAQEAYAGIAGVEGVNETEVAEALRAGSRLERIGMVENLISEHNITDLADLMKVSEQLPPVLMRQYEG